jgi:uncharacterized membrane protein YkvA (DUF1232 family)
MKIFFRKIIKDLKNYIALAKLLKDDKRVPKTSKILLALAVGYFLLPIDLIPDFIPVIGHLDDLIIVPTLIFIAIKLIPREVFDENYKQVFEKFQN